MRYRVWWVPQMPMESFKQEVKTLREAKLLIETLAFYDIFQYENNVKPDYCNAGGLQYFDERAAAWVDWTPDMIELDGDSIDDLTMAQCEAYDRRQTVVLAVHPKIDAADNYKSRRKKARQ